MTAREADYGPLMGPVARHLLGEPNRHLSEEAKGELRYGSRGSLKIDLKRGLWADYETGEGGGVLDLIARELHVANGGAAEWLAAEGFTDARQVRFEDRIECRYRYETADGKHAFDVVRLRDPKTFRQQAADGDWSVKGIPMVLYRLPQLVAAPTDALVFVVEGERDVDRLAALGLVATTNPGGAGKWRDGYARPLDGRRVAILADNDEPGRKHAGKVRASLEHAGVDAAVVELEGLPLKGDVSDWLDSGGTPARLVEIAEAALLAPKPAACPVGVAREDFVAFMPAHTYVFTPTRETWIGAAVNSRLPPAGDLSASEWLDRHRPVEQMTWAPGEPMLIKNRLITDGGWLARPGCTVLNLYRPPVIIPRAGDVTRWLDHVYWVYPGDGDHILKWLACRVQRPEEKINHALVFGGNQGVGKDTLLEPVKQAVGPWNFLETSPQQMLGRFNSFLRSVILRVSEARDLGDFDRYAFYDHTKTYIAAPPDVLRVDEKHIREYAILNVTGVIITSNHKADGIYLPADDRRHYVAWSDCSTDDFPAGYWPEIYAWFGAGGHEAVAAYLHEVDLAGFDPKAPPRKTDAFWEIVYASAAPENPEMIEALEKAGWPDAITIAILRNFADPDLATWLGERANGRKANMRLEECGYVQVRNPDAVSGRWRVGGNKLSIYANNRLAPDARRRAAESLAEGRL